MIECVIKQIRDMVIPAMFIYLSALYTFYTVIVAVINS